MQKRKIDMTKAEKILNRLEEIPDPTLSTRQFIIMNFDKLQKSGKSLQALHQFFVTGGLDIGLYKTFRSVFNDEKRARQNKIRASSEKGRKSREL